MKIYKLDEGEGFRLACDLELMRKEKHNNRAVVRCNGTLSNEIRQFKRIFVLDNGVNSILLKAKEYYLAIDNDDVMLCLRYNECQIIYYFREENDWKGIGLEIVSSELCMDFDCCESEAAGKVIALAFFTIAKFAYTYGLQRVIDRGKMNRLHDIFAAIALIEEVADDEFKAIEKNREKIIFFLSHNVMREDFVKKHLYSI